MTSAVIADIRSGESRASKRERVMLTAALSFSNRTFSVTCLVTQISAKGAKLSLSREVAISEKMNIAIPQRNIETSARLVWRRGHHAGIEFQDAVESAPPEAPKSRVRELEDENKRLRVALAKLDARMKEMQQGY
jgi:hypothetical protein